MIFGVYTQRLREIFDPFEVSPWTVQSITEKQVLEAIRKFDFARSPVPYGSSPQQHIARIAYLAVHGWSDPGHIDVGVPGISVPNHIIEDGHHRFAASLIRHDSTMPFYVSGDLAYAESLLSGFQPATYPQPSSYLKTLIEV